MKRIADKSNEDLYNHVLIYCREHAVAPVRPYGRRHVEERLRRDWINDAREMFMRGMKASKEKRVINPKFIVLLAFILSGQAQAVANFGISAALSRSEADERILSISVTIPDGYYLYSDRFDVRAPEHVELNFISGPDVEKMTDEITGMTNMVYSSDFKMNYSVAGPDADELSVTVSYQGCRKDVCFMPQSRTFNLKLDDDAVETDAGREPSVRRYDEDALPRMMDDFTIAARGAGYMNAREFLAFLDSAESAVESQKSMLQRLLDHGSLWLMILGIIIGGLALNLTPCVLPMIPVNIAIIGAGTRAGSRSRGFFMGALYGLGIAVSYGVLGLVVVLTGSVFGAFSASPWFNIGISILFFGLALAMFDVFTIDFSRFMSHGGSDGHGGSGRGAAAVFTMGMVAALLAGACVAPVVIFVLVHSAGLYTSGVRAGLFLPFLLGIGMALPWPFVGAGLSLLPKPGKWMVRVKIMFGVIILAVAGYYGFEGAKGLVRSAGMEALLDDGISSEANDIRLDSIPEALVQARETGAPVLIDFWASWCKSCLAMDATTFRDPVVRDRMNDFITVKYRAEEPNRPPHKEVLALFEVIGLPAYIILTPDDPDVRKSAMEN